MKKKWFLLVLISVILISGCTKITSVERSHKLKQIKVNKGVSGYLALFGGSINTNMYYCFYIVGENGSIVLKKVRYDKIEIYENENNNPYTKAIGRKVEYWGSKEDNYIYWDIWELHIPENSIIENFNVNLE